MTESERQHIIAELEPVLDDPKETSKRKMRFAKFFFGDRDMQQHFYLKTGDTPEIHLGMYEGLSQNHQFYYITSPRDFAKTTIVMIDTLYAIYFQTDPHILVIGKIDSSGKAFLRNIKYEIKNNPKLKDVFGNLRSGKRGDEWSSYEVQLNNGVFLRSIGMMGDARGGLKAGWRYTRIIGDDVQSIKTMRQPATLEAHQEFWERDIEYSIDKDYGKVIYIGNLLGKGCLLDVLMRDKKYKGTSFHALVNEKGEADHLHGRSTWESKWSTVRLRHEAKTMAAKGKLHVFLAERQNIITDKLDRNLNGYKFHNLHYERWHNQNVLVGDELPEPIPVYTYNWIDPAFGMDKMRHDERANVVAAKGQVYLKVDRADKFIPMNCIWILEYTFNHMDPLDIIDLSLQKHKQYHFNGVVVEAISGAKIYESIMHRSIMSDAFFSMHPFSPTFVNYHLQNKHTRILNGLQPLAKMGQFFIRASHEELIHECENLDTIKSPHILDAIEFGNAVSVPCNEYLTDDKPEPKHIRYRREQEEAKAMNWQGWCPKNLAQISLN